MMQKRISRRSKWLIFGTALAVALGGIPAASAANRASLHATVDTDRVITIEGDGFRADDDVMVKVVAPDVRRERTVTSDDSGSFTTRFRLPSTLRANVRITADGHRRFARTTVQVGMPVTTTTRPATTVAPTTTSIVRTTTTVVRPTTTTTVRPTTTTAPRPTTTTTAPQPATWWKPAVGVSWQWQLTGTIDTSVNAQVFDIDGFDASAGTVATLRSQGKRIICYISAGSYEDWRPDAGRFPAAVLGRSNGWAGEKWLDISNLNALRPIMEARMDMCKSKGFDAVEPDNIDGYTNNTGFALTASHQLAYNRFLAEAAHSRGLAIALKNDVDQIRDLVAVYDFAVNEQCFQYNECDAYSAFINAGKPVLNVEYELATSQFCPQARAMGFSSLKKNLDLDAQRTAC